jgi:hypothetical protein
MWMAAKAVRTGEVRVVTPSGTLSSNLAFQVIPKKSIAKNRTAPLTES